MRPCRPVSWAPHGGCGAPRHSRSSGDRRVWSAKLLLPDSHLRVFEALELCINLVRIKLSPYACHHLVILGVLWISDRFQNTRAAADATAILGRTGAFAREADGVALPLVQRQHLFNEPIVFTAIPEIVLVEERALLTPHKASRGARCARLRQPARPAAQDPHTRCRR